eukprot:4121849-Lingulodinium_polyedra.AAC.1
MTTRQSAMAATLRTRLFGPRHGLTRPAQPVTSDVRIDHSGTLAPIALAFALFRIRCHYI